MNDVIVLGAGAAGLAAAAALRRAGVDVLVVEARERVGGRCWSVQHAASPLPLELGAEFVHGGAPETQRLALRAGVTVCDVEGEHWRSHDGRLTRQRDFWDSVGRVLSLLPEDEQDQSFAEFLETSPGGRSLAQARTLARSFVQGFHAADLERVSTRALAEAGNPGEDEDAARHGRTVGGYGALLRPLAEEISDRIMFGEVVRRIAWKRGSVRVQTNRGEHDGRAAIVTLPLGVLQTGDVAIDPMPARLRRALDGLAMGSVARITLLFENRFWEGDAMPGLPADSTLTRLSFLHSPHTPFNIWWTLHPLRAPVIVGWSGGPPAAALDRAGDVEARAIDVLATQLGITRRRLRSQLVATFHHDWDADPFSRGAYSYAVVGGATASKRLARPVDDTLFIAGEATADAHSGTVEGALLSGARAARQVLDRPA